MALPLPGACSWAKQAFWITVSWALAVVPSHVPSLLWCPPGVARHDPPSARDVLPLPGVRCPWVRPAGTRGGRAGGLWSLSSSTPLSHPEGCPGNAGRSGVSSLLCKHSTNADFTRVLFAGKFVFIVVPWVTSSAAMDTESHPPAPFSTISPSQYSAFVLV